MRVGNIISLCFFTWFNAFVTYAYFAGRFLDFKYTALTAIAAYEFSNIFIETIFNRNDKQFWVYIAHHMGTVLLVLYVFKTPIYLEDAAVTISLVSYTTWFMNLQYEWPNTYTKCLFAFVFILFRVVILFPYTFSVFTGKYGFEAIMTVPFIGLNHWWAYLIVRKAIKHLKHIE
jgi:ABC-type iron transport system FetAB permease component